MIRKLKYKDIKDQYYIFDDGRIWSKKTKRFLTPFKDRYGYLQIKLAVNSKIKINFNLATLVAYTFLGEPPKSMIDPTVDHIDSNKLNNKYTNLQWLTRQENLAKRDKTGRTILTPNIVEKICLDLQNNMKQCDVMRKYNISKGTAHYILNKKSYKYISNKYDFSKRTNK